MLIYGTNLNKGVNSLVIPPLPILPKWIRKGAEPISTEVRTADKTLEHSEVPLNSLDSGKWNEFCEVRVYSEEEQKF
jgi:hypothetical protein